MAEHWTTEYPTKPGYYWLRNCKLSRWPTSIPKPVIVTVNKNLQVYLGLPPNESNLPYFRSDIISAEWLGPILPPEDNPNKALTELFHNRLTNRGKQVLSNQTIDELEDSALNPETPK